VSRALPVGTPNHRNPYQCWVPRPSRAMRSRGALARGTTPNRKAASTTREFIGIKHGGFARFSARNTMRLSGIPKREPKPVVLIDSRGRRPVCVSCHKLGPYLRAAGEPFVCEACVRGADNHIRLLAESVPELRDHRLRRWRRGCDCGRCEKRRAIV
jgi:hypothetical protein